MPKAAVCALCSILLGCGSHGSPSSDAAAHDTSIMLPIDATVPPYVTLPPTNAGLDYQLGGAYALPAGVTGTVYIRVRDTNQAPGSAPKDTVRVDDMYIRVE